MLGYTWKRIRKSLKSKRDQRVFDWQQAEIDAFMELHKEQYIDLYFADACHFSLTPSVRYAWQRKGEQILVPAAKSIALSVFGLMTPDCKLFSQTFQGTLNSEKIIALIDEFAQTITKQTIVVIDNAPVHHSKAFQAKIEQWKKLDLYIYFLPPYSPELNKIEILWRFIKYKWMPLDAYSNIQNLKERLSQILTNIGQPKYSINFF
jgi:transposase